MPENPHQVDISVSLFGSENHTLLTNFVKGLADLQNSMNAIAKQQEGVLRAMGQTPVPAGGATSAAASIGRASTHTGGTSGQSSHSGDNENRQILGQYGDVLYDSDRGGRQGPPPLQGGGPNDLPPYRQRMKRLGAFANFITRAAEPGIPYSADRADAEAFDNPAAARRRGGFGGGGGGGGASQPPAVEGSPAWLRELQPHIQEPLYIPRYGEFNAQDISKGISQISGKIVNSNLRKAQTQAAKDGKEDFQVGRGTEILGAVGTVASVGGDVAPYVKLLNQLSPVSLGGNQAYGRSLGYARGGADLSVGGVGFQIPGSQLFGPAGREAAQSQFDAFKGGLAPGISIKEYREIQGALEEKGYSGDDKKYAAKQIADLKKNKNIGDIGGAGTTALLFDQAARYGHDNLRKFYRVLRGVGDAARGARLGVDEYKQALDQVANDQQQKGLTYDQGLERAHSFSRATGFAPQVLPQIQGNPFFQARLLAQTGLPVAAQGLAPIPTQLRAAGQNIDLLAKAYAGFGQDQKVKVPGQYGGGNLPISGDDKVNALIAQQTGLTVDQVKEFRDPKRRKQREALGYAEQFAKNQAEAYEGVSNRTDISDKEKEKLYNQIRLGTKGVQGTASLEKALKASGASKKDIQKIIGEKNLEDRYTATQDYLDKHNQKDRKTSNTVTVELSPEAKRLLRIKDNQPHKDEANSGRARINGPAGYSARVPGSSTTPATGSDPVSVSRQQRGDG